MIVDGFKNTSKMPRGKLIMYGPLRRFMVWV